MDDLSLTWEQYEAGMVTVLELHGTLVAANLLTLEPSLAALLAQLDHPLVVNLSHVERCDAAGAVMLSAAARAAYERARCGWPHRTLPS